MNGAAAMGSNQKPHVRVIRRRWVDKATQARSEGIAVVNKADGKTLAHLTPTQARAMADRLHDLSDQLEQQQ